MEISTLYDKKYNVKIEAYHKIETYIVDEVVYFRYKMPYRLIIKWRWYFEYLTAVLKKNNPRQKFRLVIGEATKPLGDDYIKSHLPSKLKGRYIALKKAQAAVPDLDLFGFGEKEKSERVERIKREIERLEQGIWEYERFDTYINRIKKYTQE